MKSKEFYTLTDAVSFASKAGGFLQYCSYDQGGVWIVFYRYAR